MASIRLNPLIHKAQEAYDHCDSPDPETRMYAALKAISGDIASQALLSLANTVEFQGNYVDHLDIRQVAKEFKDGR